MVEAAQNICLACNTQNRVDARFCASCGGKLETSATCPGCGARNKSDAHFCRDCGLAIAGNICPACGAGNKQNAKFCLNCGTQTDRSAEQQTIPINDQGFNDEATTDGNASTIASRGNLTDRTVSEPANLYSGLVDSETWQKFLDDTKLFFRRWVSEGHALARERPYVAIGGVIAIVVLLAGLAGGIVWIGHRQMTAATNAGPAAQAVGASSGTLYATRLINIRNAPTSVGTIVLGNLNSAQAISGVWVRNPAGTEAWLHIKLNNGVDGYAWGGNLSATQYFSDPSSYCRAVRDDETPTKSTTYHGPVSTDGMVVAFAGATKDQIVWRCARSQVLACAEFSTTSCIKAPWLHKSDWDYVVRNPQVIEECRQNPEQQCAGATHCIVSCSRGRPTIQANYPVDADGYAISDWKVVN